MRSAAAGAVLALTLGACGQDVPDATEPMSAGESAQATPEPLAEEEFFPAVVEAVQEQESVAAELVVTDGAAPMTLRGAVDLSQDTPEMDLTLTMPTMPEMPQMSGGEAHVIVVDDTIYGSVPGLTPEGTYFELAAGHPLLPSAEELTGQLDPVSMSRAWKDGMTELEYVGPEDVEGQTLQHYVVTVDGLAAFGAVGVPPEAGMSDMSDMSDMSGEVPVDVWLDGENLIRKVVVEHGAGSAELELSEWGEPVEVTAPDPADVVAFPFG